MEGMYRYIFDLILVSIPSSLIRAWGVVVAWHEGFLT